MSTNVCMPRPFVTAGISFPESPRWRDSRLWFTDMYARRVCYADERGVVTEVVRVPTTAGGLGWLPSGDLLVVSMEEQRIMRLPVGGTELVEYLDLSEITGGPVNDMYVTPAGGIYVGNFGETDDAPENRPLHLPVRLTRLVFVDPDGNARQVGGELHLPNGTVERQDGTLVVAESYGPRLHEFTIEPDGSLSDQRVLVELGPEMIPDGICEDREGGIWIGTPAPDTGVVRIDRRGDVTDRIDLNATACALGGQDGRTLFLLGASYDDISEVMSARSRGYIQTVTVDVPCAAPSP